MATWGPTTNFNSCQYLCLYMYDVVMERRELYCLNGIPVRWLCGSTL